MEFIDTHSRQHVALPVAVALAYFELEGACPDLAKPDWMMQVSKDVARALSAVVPIHGLAESSTVPAQIPSADLVSGTFEHGVQSLRTIGGKVFLRLTVVRRDLWQGIRALKAAQERNRAPALSAVR